MSSFPFTDLSRRAARLVFASTLCMYVATAGGGLTSTDAVMTYEITKSLVTHGSVAVASNVASMEEHRGVDGRFYSPFGIGQSIFNIPFYVAGLAARRLLGVSVGRPDTIDKGAVALGNTVAAAGTVWVAFLMAWRLAGSVRAASLTALALGFGTLVWPYSKLGFNAALTTLCLIAGVYAVWIGVRSDRARAVGWGGVWLGCAFLTRHEMAVAAVPVAAWIAFESRADRRRLLVRLGAFAIPLAAALAFWLWYNFIRFGDPLDAGNVGDPVLGFDAPLLAGLYGLLLSPGRSLFVYVPLALAGVAALAAFGRRNPSTAALFAGLLALFLVLYSALPYWEGSRGYGPRYLVPLVPYLVIPLVLWFEPGGSRWRSLLLALAAVSVLVQVPGVVVDFSKVSVSYSRAGRGYLREARLYTWPESAIVLDTEAALRLVPENARHLIRAEHPPVAPPAADDIDFSQRLAFSLDFWWLYPYYLGAIPAWLSIVFGIAPFGAACLLLARLSRISRSSESMAGVAR